MPIIEGPQTEIMADGVVIATGTEPSRTGGRIVQETGHVREFVVVQSRRREPDDLGPAIHAYHILGQFGRKRLSATAYRFWSMSNKR